MIKNSTSLRDFRNLHSDCAVKLPQFVNQETGEIFHSLAFVRDSKVVCLVGFSQKLGELTSSEIAAQIDNLEVVELESGSFKLCRRGQSEDWQDIEI